MVIEQRKRQAALQNTMLVVRTSSQENGRGGEPKRGECSHLKTSWPEFAALITEIKAPAVIMYTKNTREASSNTVLIFKKATFGAHVIVSQGLAAGDCSSFILQKSFL